MADTPSKLLHPVCPKHWRELREQALQGLPFWTRPFAGGTVNKMLRERGFVESDSECSFCQTGSRVDHVS